MGKITVKVIPSSSRDAIVGWLDEALKIKVKAPPERGKANIAVIDLLATKLGVDKRSIEVISGHSSPAKIIEIHGLDDAQIVVSIENLKI
jgi:uncharacterized protein